MGQPMIPNSSKRSNIIIKRRSKVKSDEMNSVNNEGVT